jgi:hypothetical protein
LKKCDGVGAGQDVQGDRSGQAGPGGAAGGDQHAPGLGRPPGPQISSIFDVVEDQQPAVPGAELVPQDLDGLGLLGGLGDAEASAQGDQLAGNGGGLLGHDPPDQVVVAAVPIRVFEGELGLAHPAQPVHSLRLDNGSGLPGLEAGSKLVQEALAAGEDQVAGGQVSHHGLSATHPTQPLQHRGRQGGRVVDVDCTGLPDNDQLANLSMAGDRGCQPRERRVLGGLADQPAEPRPDPVVPIGQHLQELGQGGDRRRILGTSGDLTQGHLHVRVGVRDLLKQSADLGQLSNLGQAGGVRFRVAPLDFERLARK